ncbi:class 1 fructose-bisphosphatase [Novosphingobium sp. Gsoil 351]|uniref:class 1 fructose-bisphosphatase n=1 Tax=Novosphingobium sp. Gsoil 351 TaxID=2675225 RepID=UPI0012B4B2D5|nr:class 1 fructose-bisphosphatase [Novosphingobium sp. Gsoil 351]QGN54565.1 class 1 fructose-bisphosphatase [Novosphingobium sp. Gsoil 351]
MIGTTLDDWLDRHRATDAAQGAAVADTIAILARTGAGLAATIAAGPLGGTVADPGAVNAGGDAQRGLDLLADDRFLTALSRSPVGLYASEELAQPVVIDAARPLALAIDPLDGSSNIDTNVSIGTIFSVRANDAGADPLAPFLRSGREQLAAGFLIYGPQLALVLSLGEGTQIFIHDPAEGAFRLINERSAIPPKTREFAINASNYRHWHEAVRLYFDDCLKGGHGPREDEFNMRWVASLVAETYRILARGGTFLYPGDRRRGYAKGRLRLVYEAQPIAMLIEQAGGLATDTIEPILDLCATELHQRVPLVFGSANEVRRIGRYHTRPSDMSDRAPLFAKRTLFQA